MVFTYIGWYFHYYLVVKGIGDVGEAIVRFDVDEVCSSHSKEKLFHLGMIDQFPRWE